jgi:hypothetical protein
MVRITVNQAKIKAEDPNPIHVHHVDCDIREDVSHVRIHGPSEIKYASAGNELADGSRVWIETAASVSATTQPGYSLTERPPDYNKGDDCPRCGGSEREVRNHSAMWGDGDVHCRTCGQFLRDWDSG